MTKFFLLQYFIFISECVNQNGGTCDAISLSAKEVINKYCLTFENSQSLKIRTQRWNDLIFNLCQRIELRPHILILERRNQFSTINDGLIFLPSQNLFYYYKDNSKQFDVAVQKDELIGLKEIMIQLEKNFQSNSKKLIDKSNTLIVYDATYLYILYLNPADTTQSSFFSVKYFPDMLQIISFNN